ncbi:hypothetical protein FISHEDRAFT_6321, partial [Fistulina hepatica ATCC 64428]
MAPLTVFPLPLPPNAPPAGYGWEERDVSISNSSTTTAFDIAMDERDRFLGQCRCRLWGGRSPSSPLAALSHYQRWSDLRKRGSIPSQAKHHPRHEPRNGLLMCANHHIFFDAYDFFIRFFPDTRKFVFVNYSGRPSLQRFHGKVIAFDIGDRHAPFPSLFIIHEMRVRGFHPFRPIAPDIPADGSLSQDWIVSDDVFDSASGFFNRDTPPCSGDDNSVSAQARLQFQPTTTSADGVSSGVHRLALNEDVINDILAATRAMPSWKACEMEGTAWTGTAEENIQKH